MINRVSTVSVFVSDQNRAKDFYTNVLGFTLVSDQPLWPGSETRWVTVKAPDGQLEIVLYSPDENWAHYRQVVGHMQNITFGVIDIAATVAALQAKGVSFSGEIDVQPWGSSIILHDSESNQLLLVEQPKF